MTLPRLDSKDSPPAFTADVRSLAEYFRRHRSDRTVMVLPRGAFSRKATMATNQKRASRETFTEARSLETEGFTSDIWG